MIPAWVTSLDVVATHGDPRSALIERLARHFRIVLYDQPGTGLSRRIVTDFTLDGAVADLVGVIEATGGAPVSLLAMSAAGPCAVVTAARRPDLVRDLVLFGTFADPAVAFPDPAFSRAMVDVVRARWGRGTAMVAQLFRPGVSDAAAERLGAVLRESADPPTGAAYLAATFTSDAGPMLSSVHQPALVIHYRGDKVVPFAGGEHSRHRCPRRASCPSKAATTYPMSPMSTGSTGRCGASSTAPRADGQRTPRQRRGSDASGRHRNIDPCPLRSPSTAPSDPTASPGGTPGSSTPSTV